MNELPQKNVLLTLGRLPVALDVARSFHLSGWRVLVAEPWPMHLARLSHAVARCFRVASPVEDGARYCADLRNIIVSNDVDLVVPISEESMTAAALCDNLPPGVEIFCMPQLRMLELHDKYRFVRLAESFGLRVPKSHLASSSGRTELCANHDFVMKPRYSCSGRDVSFHAAGASVETRDDMLVQEKLEGEHYSSFSIARDGKALATSVYRATVTDGSVAVAFERVDDDSDIDAWTSAFIRQSEHTGFIAFDFVVGVDGQASAMECNPRATSGIHFLTAAALTPLILGQQAAVPLRRSETQLTESYSCFTATLASLFSRRRLARNLQALRRATDITWSRADPWPFLLMMINSWRIVGHALFTRSSFAAAAVRDIEWREPGEG